MKDMKKPNKIVKSWRESGKVAMVRLCVEDPKIRKIKIKPKSGILKMEVSNTKKHHFGWKTYFLRGKEGRGGQFFVLNGDAMHKIDKWYNMEVEDEEEVRDAGDEIRKVETREELEHRKNSINYKLKMIRNEEEIELKVENGEIRDLGQEILPKQISSSEEKFVEQRLLDLIKKKVILNYSDLHEAWSDKISTDRIERILFNMTIPLSGRFILKSVFYDPSLVVQRNALISLFMQSNTISCTKIPSLGAEKNLLTDISYAENGHFYLKGKNENHTLNITRIENQISEELIEILEKEKMCTVFYLSETTRLCKDVITNILSKAESFLKLDNHKYAHCDPKDAFYAILNKLTESNSITVAKIKLVVDYTKQVKERLLLYCNFKGDKYTLRNI